MGVLLCTPACLRLQVTTGASDDFNEATELAEKMVANYGMSEAVGVRTYRDSDAAARSEVVDSEISRLLNVTLFFSSFFHFVCAAHFIQNIKLLVS